MDVTYRALSDADAPAIVEIMGAAEVAEPADVFTSLAEMQEDMTQPGVDLPRGSVGAMSGDRLVGFGSLISPPSVDQWVSYVTGAVHPNFRGQGIGRTILDRLAEQARALRAVHHADLPAELKIWVSNGRRSAAALATSAGFVVRRYFIEMRAELATPPEIAPLPGLTVRPWTPSDDDGARLAYNAAFADHWGSVPMDEERWRRSFAESPFFRPEMSRLALSGDEVVGFVLVDEFDSETEARGYRTGYIDRVGSVRSVRGRGVATALMTESMVAMAEFGYRIAELGVDADSPTGAGRLYERLGFAVRHRNEVYGLEF
jgi:mycothiol synthase